MENTFLVKRTEKFCHAHFEIAFFVEINSLDICKEDFIKKAKKNLLYFSYLKRSIDNYLLVRKFKMHSSQICIKCIQFYSRIDSYIEYTHQMK